MNPIRVGLIGLGNSGCFYHLVPHLSGSDRFDLAMVCASDPGRVEEVASTCGARGVLDWRRVVEDPSVDLVVIATPHSLHYEMAMGGIAAGKHVHVDKPLTTTTTQADDLIAAAKAAGVVLSVHHQRRFEHDYQVLTQLVEGGAIGDLWKVEVTRSHAGRYRTAAADRPHQGDSVLGWPHERRFGGGISWLVAPHPVDQLLELVGAGTTHVVGTSHTAAGDEVEEFIGLEVAFSSGVLGRVEVFRRAGIAPARFRVYGTEGTIVAPNASELQVSQVGKSAFGVSGLTPPGVLGEEIYTGLYRAIREDGALAVSAEEARDVVQVLEAGLASAATAGTAIATRPTAARHRSTSRY